METTPEVLSGSVADMPASVLLRTLARAKATGVLRIGHEAPSWAALNEGDIVIAGTSGPSIVDSLRAQGIIDDEVLGGLEHRRSHDLAAVTELMAVLPIEILSPALRQQVVRAVFHMLLPSTDRFAFQPAPPIDLAATFAFPVEDVVIEAEEQLREWVRIAASIPTTQAVFRPTRNLDTNLSDVQLGRDEWSALAVLDGRRTVAQAIGAAGRDSYEFCAVLHGLLQRGLIERIS